MKGRAHGLVGGDDRGEKFRVVELLPEQALAQAAVFPAQLEDFDGVLDAADEGVARLGLDDEVEGAEADAVGPRF
jgi:hypothetical protein